MGLVGFIGLVRLVGLVSLGGILGSSSVSFGRFGGLSGQLRLYLVPWAWWVCVWRKLVGVARCASHLLFI